MNADSCDNSFVCRRAACRSSCVHSSRVCIVLRPRVILTLLIQLGVTEVRAVVPFRNCRLCWIFFIFAKINFVMGRTKRVGVWVRLEKAFTKVRGTMHFLKLSSNTSSNAPRQAISVRTVSENLNGGVIKPSFASL